MVQASIPILLLGSYLVLTQLHVHAYDYSYLPLKNCASNNSYVKGSIFKSNLIVLLNLLYAKAQTDGGFADQSYGNGTDVAYGLITCYVDSTVESCFDCLKNATSQAQRMCPGSAIATMIYEQCLLKYSTNDFSSQLDYDYRSWACESSGSAFLSEISKTTTATLLLNLSTNATKNHEIAATRVITTDAKNISALVQCNRDLPPDKCQECVKHAISENDFSDCSGTQGWPAVGARIITSSCYMRYDTENSIEITQFPMGIAPVPATAPAAEESISRIAIMVIGITAALVVAGLATSGFCLLKKWRKWRKNQTNKNTTGENDATCLHENVETELKYILNPNAEYEVFDLTVLRIATNEFSDINKLGKGGFGSVFKGILPNGLEIAVKRLSGGSIQGTNEFRNEVDSLAKLKHKNLVQLLGCCITKEEKLLCYEYLSNGSLDKILFEKHTSRHKELCWELRFKIIEGIIHGLHYLHEESRIKIVHRDLKVGNILLDKDMNPKISDFGLARFFEDDQTHIETNVLAGTFGYMAPEYIFYGNFSAKSDIYSFGVLLLEILTGQKSSSFVGSGRISNFIEYAFVHWINGTVSQLKDQNLEEECVEEIKRCVHIALLCVQENPVDRPSIATIRNMLTASLKIPDLPSAPLVCTIPAQLKFLILEANSTATEYKDGNQAE